MYYPANFKDEKSTIKVSFNDLAQGLCGKGCVQGSNTAYLLSKPTSNIPLSCCPRDSCHFLSSFA